MKSLNSLDRWTESFPMTDRLPALFVGHGSPMNAIEENRFVQGFRRVSNEFPRPAAILCISAHWFTLGTRVTAMTSPRTIHDFGGFPKSLYSVQYPAPGCPDLAMATEALLQPAVVQQDLQWGFDHGAWTVARHMYPEADVPLVQLSIDRTLPPEKHFRLGQALDSLRDRGVLLLGSGNIVHNLGRVDFHNFDQPDHGYDWAREARDFVNQCICKREYEPLLDYDSQGAALRLAIPTPEHFLPLLYILGLQHDPEKTTLFNDELLAGSLSMTSVQVH